MIGIWNEIPQLLGSRIPNLSHLQLAQNGTADPLGLGGLAIGSFSVIDIVIALAVLIIGYIIALFGKSLVKSLLKKTDVDNKIASWVSGGRNGADNLPIEDWIGSLVFWLIFLFAIIGFLERLQLTAASTPLTSLLNQITEFLPRILVALLLLGGAWILATLVRGLVVRLLDTFGLDRRLNTQVGNDTTTTNQFFSQRNNWKCTLLVHFPIVLITDSGHFELRRFADSHSANAQRSPVYAAECFGGYFNRCNRLGDCSNCSSNCYQFTECDWDRSTRQSIWLSTNYWRSELILNYRNGCLCSDFDSDCDRRVKCTAN
jgi:hypothetical protein